ncbi:MAG: hypothetical protein J5713_00610 [Clostridia bacterium]|nr:hypothetical protein [Clostridia bacterium]
MKNVKSILLVGFVLIVAVLVATCLFGCAKNDAPTPNDNPQPDANPQPDGHVKVILLAGQSNAVGYTYDEFDKTPGAYDETRIAKIYEGFENVKIRFSNNPYIAGSTNANSEFEPVGLNQGVPKPNAETNSIGPEVGIAEYLLTAFPNETFYIIKCATGGSNLSYHWSVENHDAGSLYAQMVEVATGALGQLEAQGLIPEIVAFCWMQGESDSYVDDGQSYINGFDALIKQFEQDFAKYIPEKGMAVIDAGIKDTPSCWPYYQTINAAKQGYAEESELRFYFDTYDLNLKGNDPAHYDFYGQLALGNRFGNKIAQAIAIIYAE